MQSELPSKWPMKQLSFEGFHCMLKKSSLFLTPQMQWPYLCRQEILQKTLVQSDCSAHTQLPYIIHRFHYPKIQLKSHDHYTVPTEQAIISQSDIDHVLSMDKLKRKQYLCVSSMAIGIYVYLSFNSWLFHILTEMVQSQLPSEGLMFPSSHHPSTSPEAFSML